MREHLRTYLLVAAVVVLIALLVVPIVATLRPDYYEKYPALSERMDHWATSTHSKISCAACHVKPGAGGAVKFAVEAIPAFYSRAINGPKKTNLLTTPGIDACRKCHTAFRKVAPSGDLLIPHKAHVDVLKMDCAECHKSLVHSPNRRGFNRPEMESCLAQCHNGDKASDACVDCHTHKNTPKTHDRKDWLLVHGKQSKMDDCGSCHDWTPDYCSDCHEKRPASHTGNWKTAHAEPAKVRGDGCNVCHGGKQFCKECH